MAETLYASGSSSGGCLTPTNAVGTTSGTWTTNIDNSSWTHIWDLDNPVGTLEGTDVVEVLIRARHQDGTGNPTINSVRILESGTERGANSTGWTITSASGEDVTLTVSVSGMTNWDNAQIEIATTAAGGSPSVRSAVQVDYMHATVQNASTDRKAQVAWAELEVPNAPSDAPTIIGSVASGASGADVSSYSGVSHTLVAGLNRKVLVWVTYDDTGETGAQVSGVTYGGVSMTKVTDGTTTGDAVMLSTNTTASELFQLDESSLPANGANTIAVTMASVVDGIQVGAICLENATQGNAHKVAVQEADGGTTLSITIVPTSNNTFILDAWGLSTGVGGGTPDAPQTELTDFDGAGSGMGQVSSWKTQTTAASTTMGWTVGTSQGRAAAVAAAFTKTAGTTDRQARVSFAELEVPSAPRRAEVSWAELEVPTAPRRAEVSWAEMEIPTAPRRVQVSWAELELPDAPREAQVSWAELEVPDAPRRAQVSWAELEIPNPDRRVEVSWAEFEVPNAPTTDREAQVSWAEFEVPDGARRVQVSFAELEVPLAPRRGQVSFAEFEVPLGVRRAQVSWAEFEVPTAPRRSQVSFAELEVPDAPRRAQVSFAEVEVPTAPRRAQVSWAEIEMPNFARSAIVTWAEMEVPSPVGLYTRTRGLMKYIWKG